MCVDIYIYTYIYLCICVVCIYNYTYVKFGSYYIYPAHINIFYIFLNDCITQCNAIHN